MTTLADLEQQYLENPPPTPAMQDMMAELHEILANPEVRAAYDDAARNAEPNIEFAGLGTNPWRDQSVDFFEAYFRSWFTFLPKPAGGLGKIIPFSFFYLNNPKGYEFLNTFRSSRQANTPKYTEIFDWIVNFVKLRGSFMDSEASAIYVDEWISYLGDAMNDFVIPENGYKSFNQFFIRQLKTEANPRPISKPEDDSVVVAPADSVINFIISDLTLTEKMDVKTRQLNVRELLQDSVYARYFEGGAAVSCVLLPQNYHHYHSPVSGRVVESVEIPGIFFGMTDGNNFLNRLNFGQGTTDFSLFEDFHRAYYIIDTGAHGYVALVPVGLNTISSINPSLVCNTMVQPGGDPLPVSKGQELGYFAYGGSLNILLFQAGVMPSLSVQMGNRIGAMKKIEMASS